MSKRVIITSAQYGAKVNKDFLSSLETYANKNNAELLILPMAGKSVVEDELSEILYDYKIINKDYKLNDKIRISDYQIRPQQIDPITGLARFTQSDVSTIFASSKIRMVVVPNSNIKLPKVLMTTGAVTHPNYKENRIGKIAEKDHTYGAVVVEIIDKINYHYRHITAQKNGSFVDLGAKYSQKKPVKCERPEALVLGDWHTGDTDPKARAEAFRMIRTYKPKRIFLHDVFNGYSINHHERQDKIIRSQNSDKSSLEKELNKLADELAYFVENSPKDCKIYVVKSNHDEWLYRYVSEGVFMEDPQNTIIGAELLIDSFKGKDILESAFNKFYKTPNNLIFLQRDEDIKVRGWQLANHGDLGSSGKRGSIRTHEQANGKAITGHSHKPEVFRNICVVGTNTYLKLNYNKGYSGWMQTNAFLYSNGTVQLINTINGKHKF